ncbi:MAG: hypothetical protein IK080_11030 [Clostridia bacterium]|nr:hypothetical protein [Clostridia bacterium]
MKKKLWLIPAAVLILALAVCIPNAGFRVVSGMAQELQRTKFSPVRTQAFAPYTPLFPTPEVENGYVPQGLCYLEKAQVYVLSAYHETQPSVLILTDAAAGTRLKTLALAQADGQPFTGHLGGVATDGDWLYLTDEAKVQRLAVSAVLQAADGETLPLTESFLTDLRCSFLSCDGAYLYAGEFYNFTFDGSFDTDPDHWRRVSFFERYYARCCAYPLASLDAACEAGTVTTPEYVLTLPRCVQGLARMPDGSLRLSVSYGRNNPSYLLTYTDVTAWDPDGSVLYGDERVPIYYLYQKACTARAELPPMLEGIAAVNGQTVGVFESCAAKYADGAFPVDAVCSFS